MSTSKIILLPVPWEVTTSYGAGTSLGPLLIYKASEQVDLFDYHTNNSYESGFHMISYPENLKKKNDQLKKIIKEQKDLSASSLALINQGCEEMVKWVYDQTQSFLQQNKIVGIVGGDHSVPLGAIKAIGEKYSGQFGILHLDAHSDLRKCYQNFNHSHASIMHNVLALKERPSLLVQVGIRDYCEEEHLFIQSNNSTIKTFFDASIKHRLLKGESWSVICSEIVSHLPKFVYISMDIDGLQPSLCPGTGTPVPGGLDFDQFVELLCELQRQNKTIIGFDLCEVSAGSISDQPLKERYWDGIVGARVLYKLCGFASLLSPSTNV